MNGSMINAAKYGLFKCLQKRSKSKFVIFIATYSKLNTTHPGGGGALPYMSYTGTCRWIVYGFWRLCPEQGI